jgi:GR25 family glycosyltransferase involved in LPS biosynthesis
MENVGLDYVQREVAMVRAVCISRASDITRRDWTAKAVPSFLDWSFLDATDGHHPEEIGPEFAELLSATFWGQRHIKPGAFGCFVSHFRAWQFCSILGEPMLVLEDDVEFSPQAQALLEMGRARLRDILFFNRRAVRWHRICEEKLNWVAEPVRPLSEVTTAIIEAGFVPQHHSDPGADSYLISPTGARKLIEASQICGAAVGVDWFMVGCALGPLRPVGAWDTPGRAAKFVEQPVAMDVDVARDWVAGSAGINVVGESTIDHKVMVSLTDYARRLNRGSTPTSASPSPLPG